MRIGYFGGSFNPVHAGHMALASAALKELNLSGLLVMPTKNPPHKAPLELDDATRLHLVRQTLGALPGAHVSQQELQGAGTQYTIETLEALGASPRSGRSDGGGPKNSGPRFTLILGADSFLSLPTWRRFNELVTMADFAVGQRSMTVPQTTSFKAITELSSALTAQGAKVQLLSTPLPAVSSSQVRALWVHAHAKHSPETLLSDLNRDLGALVPPPVLQYLIRTPPSVN